MPTGGQGGREPTGARVKLATVAEAAGVSSATVSKVLHGRPDVAPATRARVQSVLSDHRYVQRRGPRARPLARTGLIELAFSDLDNPWANEVVNGAESAARPEGVAVVVSAMETPAERRAWVKAVSERKPDGIVLALLSLPTADLRRITGMGIPMISVEPVGESQSGIPSIGASNWAGGLSATQHLIELGHTRIAAITGPMELLHSQARLDGYRSALARAGIPVEESLVREGNYLFVGALDATLDLLELPDPPTAIFAASDLEALGVYEGARRRGYRVPEDLSVVGFDDIALASWSTPPLTTVRQPVRDMAAMATRSLLAASAANALPDVRRIEVATTLVVRESTGRPGQRPVRRSR